MLDGERGTFRFGFGGAEDDDDDAEDERRDGKRARAEDRAAEEIDASSLECDDEVISKPLPDGCYCTCVVFYRHTLS